MPVFWMKVRAEKYRSELADGWSAFQGNKRITVQVGSRIGQLHFQHREELVERLGSRVEKVEIIANIQGGGRGQTDVFDPENSWIVNYPDGTKEVVVEERFRTLFQETQ